MFTLPRITFPSTRPRPDVGPLLRVPALTQADRRRLAELVPSTDVLRLPPGQALVTAGAPAAELIVLLSGQVAVLHPDGTGAVLRAGTQVGLHELLAYRRHAATVVALTPLEVVVVNAPAVRWAHAEGLVRYAPPATPPTPPTPSLPARPRQGRPEPKPASTR
jgi:hypothetical protein